MFDDYPLLMGMYRSALSISKAKVRNISLGIVCGTGGQRAVGAKHKRNKQILTIPNPPKSLQTPPQSLQLLVVIAAIAALYPILCIHLAREVVASSSHGFAATDSSPIIT